MSPCSATHTLLEESKQEVFSPVIQIKIGLESWQCYTPSRPTYQKENIIFTFSQTRLLIKLCKLLNKMYLEQYIYIYIHLRYFQVHFCSHHYIGASSLGFEYESNFVIGNANRISADFYWNVEKQDAKPVCNSCFFSPPLGSLNYLRFVKMHIHFLVLQTVFHFTHFLSSRMLISFNIM